MTAAQIIADIQTVVYVGGQILAYFLVVVGFAATAMANLPQGKPGSKWDTFRTVVNYIAANYGHAKNVKENP